MLSWTPPTQALCADSFSRPFKVLASATVVLAWTWGIYLWCSGALALNLQSSGWLLAALAMMSCTVWYVLVGRTTLTAETISQRWVWSKQARIGDLAYAKLLHVRGLESVIAPRLYTRTHTGKMAVFYTADPVLLQYWDALQIALQQARRAP